MRHPKNPFPERTRLGLTLPEFAKLIGIGKRRLQTYELLERALPPHIAVKIAATEGKEKGFEKAVSLAEAFRKQILLEAGL